MSDVVVLKIGGAVLGEEAGALDVVGALHDSGHSLVVVHGGGPLATEWSGRLGLPTRFVRGLRVTDAPTRDVALATLAGLANSRVVAALIARGVPAVGLSGVDGGMLRAEREDTELGLVGRLGARLLVFVTDVPGVRSKDGKVIESLDTARAKTLVDDGTIEGGMVPKVEACLLAASAGCRAAIVAARGADAIEKLLTGELVGTVFEAAA